MPKTRPAYPAKFRRPMVELVRAGLTATERDELVRLRRENRQSTLERDILSRATA